MKLIKKIVLTKRKQHGNLTKLSQTTAKNEKIISVVRLKGAAGSKKFLKIFKKLLTKKNSCVNITKLSRKTTAKNLDK